MANRRNLKKKIAHICGILAMECMVAVQNGRITAEQSDQIIVDILNLQDEFFHESIIPKRVLSGCSIVN